MKLISYEYQGQTSFGAVKDDRIIDLKMQLGSQYSDLRALLAAEHNAGIEEASNAVTKSMGTLLLSDVTLLPPIPNPGSIWCAGMNTHSHFAEAKAHMNLKDLPMKPILFLRSTPTLVASGQTLEKPKLETRFDFEGEIALVIGKRGRNIPVSEAISYIAGYSCFNDASARDYQTSSPQITAGKNGYRSGGFGPYLVTPDEVNLDTMTLSCRVNGQKMQHMTLDDLIFNFAELISFVSEFTWIEPGDVFVTGAAEGVGVLRKPQVLLKDGDLVEVEVSGIGTLINTVQEQV